MAEPLTNPLAVVVTGLFVLAILSYLRAVYEGRAPMIN